VQEPWPEDFCDAYDLIGAFDRSGARFDPELFGGLTAEVDPLTWMRITKIGEARTDEIAETDERAFARLVSAGWRIELHSRQGRERLAVRLPPSLAKLSGIKSGKRSGVLVQRNITARNKLADRLNHQWW
jgi:hypothetical protein